MKEYQKLFDMPLEQSMSFLPIHFSLDFCFSLINFIYLPLFMYSIPTFSLILFHLSLSFYFYFEHAKANFVNELLNLVKWYGVIFSFALNWYVFLEFKVTFLGFECYPLCFYWLKYLKFFNSISINKLRNTCLDYF